MVKVAAPCLSLDASGQLAGSMVFSKWKGRPYVRSLVVPANPQSGPQTGMRAMFKYLSQAWASVPALDQATWDALATAAATSPFNQFMKYNQARWRNFLGPSEAYPAALASTSPSAPTGVATGGVRQVSIALTKGANAPDAGYMIFKGSTGFTPAYSNCIAVVPIDGSGNGAYVDTPVDAGTYYYKAKGFMDDGQLGTLSAEFSGTAT